MSYPYPITRIESVCASMALENNRKDDSDPHVTAYSEQILELSELLGRNKLHTSFMRVHSDAMAVTGINFGDIVVVDRSIKATSGMIVVASLNGKLLIRKFEKQHGKTLLVPQTAHLSAIEIEVGDESFSIWGVVTFVIHAV